jgi:hypothetical protein
VRISLRRAAILVDSSGAAGGSSEADGGLPPIAEGSMKHSRSARSLAEALSSLEQVPLPASCLAVAGFAHDSLQVDTSAPGHVDKRGLRSSATCDDFGLLRSVLAVACVSWMCVTTRRMPNRTGGGTGSDGGAAGPEGDNAKRAAATDGAAWDSEAWSMGQQLQPHRSWQHRQEHMTAARVGNHWRRTVAWQGVARCSRRVRSGWQMANMLGLGVRRVSVTLV